MDKMARIPYPGSNINTVLYLTCVYKFSSDLFQTTLKIYYTYILSIEVFIGIIG